MKSKIKEFGKAAFRIISFTSIILVIYIFLSLTTYHGCGKEQDKIDSGSKWLRAGCVEGYLFAYPVTSTGYPIGGITQILNDDLEPVKCKE